MKTRSDLRQPDAFAAPTAKSTRRASRNGLRTLQDVHIEMLSHILAIRQLADLVGDTSREEIVLGLDQTIDFLERQVGPHAVADERVLCPEVARLVGTDIAMSTMSRDHTEIARLAGELDALRSRVKHSGTLTRPIMQALRRVLYGLGEVIRLHVAKEEEIFLPLVRDQLDAHEQATLAKRVELAMAMGRHPSHPPLIAHS